MEVIPCSSELILACEAPVLSSERSQSARFRVHRGVVHVFLANGNNQADSFHFLEILENFHVIWVASFFCVLIARIERVLVLRTWEVDDKLP